MVNMYSWLRCNLYAIFLICVSTMTHATATPKDIAMGGYAFPVVCTSPTDLNYCVKASESDAEKQACFLWQVKLDPTYGYAFTAVQSLSNGTKQCLWTGKIPSNGAVSYYTIALTYKNGLCPVKDAPPPEQVVFSRTGRWFPQELSTKRCYRSCEYQNGQSFDYKQYTFTNGVMTTFTEKMNSRLQSTQTFCDPVPEPARNDQGEITYDANCADSFLTVFCNFVEWYRSDAEMPTAPEVQSEQINLGYIKADHVLIESNVQNQCFQPIEFNFFLTWSRDEVKQEISFDAICSKIYEYGNLWRACYLLAACFVIFGGRK